MKRNLSKQSMNSGFGVCDGVHLVANLNLSNAKAFDS